MDIERLKDSARHRQRPRIDFALLAVMMAAAVPEAAVLVEILDVDFDGAGKDGLLTLRRIAASASRHEEVGVTVLRAAGGDSTGVQQGPHGQNGRRSAPLPSQLSAIHSQGSCRRETEFMGCWMTITGPTADTMRPGR